MTKKQITTTGIILSVCIIVSVLSGIIASIATQRSLDTYLESLSDADIVLSLSKVKPTAVPGTYEEALTSVLASRDSLAVIYPATEKSTQPGSWLFASDAYGAGIVVTSDGWILVDDDVISGVKNVDDLSILINKIWYTPTERIEDSRMAVSMLHVEATNLRAVTFSASDQTQEGEFVFAMSDKEAVQVTTLVANNVYAQDKSMPAENYEQAWVLQDEVENGTLLFDQSGGLLGIGQENKIVWPIHTLTSFIESVLAGSASVYPALGTFVISIEQGLSADTQILGTEHGYMIVRLPGYASAFTVNSPARTAGLKEYDVIVSVGGADISSAYPLAKALDRYEVGEQIILGVMRSGEYQEFAVTLGDYNLLY
ncbi:PDZ domain-containing protein [Patescibacteria group bacterium]|nr:PDZ domain-containing protein [Patescibacteria group bacterium]